MFASAAHAQDPPPPRIGPFVVDLHANVPRFPNSPLLAASRGLSQTERLPGSGLGVELGAHLYLMKWRAITFGVGGQLTLGRSRATPATVPGQPVGRPVTERFTSIAPQVSFNFGTGTGWSYLSGGLGQSTWSLVPDGAPRRLVDQEKLKTINYGGGARWFAKPHLAFSFDVRFYAINPGTVEPGFAQSPRTTLLIIGAGVSVK